MNILFFLVILTNITLNSALNDCNPNRPTNCSEKIKPVCALFKNGMIKSIKNSCLAC